MNRRSRMLVRGCVLVLAAGALLELAGCRAEKGTVSGCPSATPAAPVDETVMAFLSAARALHHEADVKDQGGDVPGAIASLEKLVALPEPHATEVDEVLADAYGRLAEMRLETKDWAAADRDVRAGLEHTREPTYFRGHLLEVCGLIEEGRAAALADAGNRDEATHARARAVDLFERAAGVQEQVIARTLGDGGARD